MMYMPDFKMLRQYLLRSVKVSRKAKTQLSKSGYNLCLMLSEHVVTIRYFKSRWCWNVDLHKFRCRPRDILNRNFGRLFRHNRFILFMRLWLSAHS